MSLTGCLKKAGSVLASEDRAAVVARARKLRAAGESADAAGVSALKAQLTIVSSALRELQSRPAEPVAPVAEAKPAAVAAPVAEAEPAAAPVRGAPDSRGRSDAGELRTELAKFLRVGALGRSVVVVQSAEGLPMAPGRAESLGVNERTQAFVIGSQAFLIADNIEPGKGKAVFMHEVGSHLGLQKMLSDGEFKQLVTTVMGWAGGKAGPEAQALARRAMERVRSAQTPGSQYNTELVAYTIEEAIGAGYNPMAAGKEGPIKAFMRSVMQMFKTLVTKLGMNPDKFTVQDLVDMAYGAAQAVPGVEADANASGGVTDTPAFKKWFGDSKVVDADGQPLRVYHGTNKSESGEAITSFDTYGGNYGLFGLGAYFTENAEVASSYVKKGRGTTPTVYAAYLSIKNPIDMDAKADAEAWQKGFPDVEFESDYKPDGDTNEAYYRAAEEYQRDNDALTYEAAEELQGGLLSMGYDGLTHIGGGRVKSEGVKHRVYIAFESEQIKSATGNNGNFDPANARIDKSTRADTPVQFSKSAPQLMATARRVAGRSGQLLAIDGIDALKRAVTSLAFLHDLVDEYKGRLKALPKWHNSVQDTLATRNKLMADAEVIAVDSGKIKNGTERVNDFLSRSTFEQKWGYDPKFTGRTVVVDGAMAVQFNRLSKPEQDVVKAVFAHSEKMHTVKTALLKKLNLGTDIFTGTGKVQGPYAPLKRFGDYIAVLKSAELLEAEKMGDTDLAKALKQDPDNYVVSHFDTRGQAVLFARENDKANGGAFGFTDSFKKSVSVGEQRPMNADLLQRVLASVGMDANVDGPAKEAMTKLIKDMYFQSIDEQHARTSGIKRLNRAGYDQDMLRSFLSHARAEAGFLANLEHGGVTNEAFYEMQTQAKDPNTGKRVGQDVFNTFAAHYAESLKYEETPWQDRAMALTSAWQLATSIGYHVTNAMQGVMVTVPKLGADFNDYGGAWKALLAGYGTLKETGWRGNITIDSVKDVGLRGALQRAADMDVLTVGMDEDLTRFEATRTGIGAVDMASAAARKAMHLLRTVSRSVELANRVASATAGYNMSIAAGKTVAEAQEYAVRILQTTQGDASRVGAPLLLKRIPKVMTQYRKYQLTMAALYAKAFRDATMGATPEVKAIGRRMLAYKLLHTTMAAGVLGMPTMNLVGLVFSALGDDDEPQDLERTLRESLGDPMLANLLLHGPLAMAGLDMSSKLGDNNIFSIMPYTDWDISSAAGIKSTLFGLIGPSASQAAKMADGVGAMERGDYYKGLEKFMPSGVSNAMKAFRINNEGYTLKNGDVMFRPEDISGFSLVLDSIGMPSTELKRMDWLRSQDYEARKFYTDQTQSIQRAYAIATREGDTDATQQLREDWTRLQDGKANLKESLGTPDYLKRQPLSNLLRYPQTVAKRGEKLQANAPRE